MSHKNTTLLKTPIFIFEEPVKFRYMSYILFWNWNWYYQSIQFISHNSFWDLSPQQGLFHRRPYVVNHCHQAPVNLRQKSPVLVHMPSLYCCLVATLSFSIKLIFITNSQSIWFLKLQHSPYPQPFLPSPPTHFTANLYMH